MINFNMEIFEYTAEKFDFYVRNGNLAKIFLSAVICNFLGWGQFFQRFVARSSKLCYAFSTCLGITFNERWQTNIYLLTDYRHTMAKSLILCGPNSNSNPNPK